MNIRQKKKKLKKPTDDYMCSGDACNLLQEGQLVRVALDAPIEVHDQKKLSGKFRDSDIRYEIKPKKIAQVIIEPQEPPLYLVEDSHGKTDHRQAYTKNQLLPVKVNEKNADEKEIRPIKIDGHKLYKVEMILDKKKEKNRIYYLIKWAGIKDPSWEPKTNLVNTIHDMIKDFEEDLKD